MAQLSGIDLYVEYGGTDISGTGRSVDLNEDKGESEKIDITHKGDTSRQQVLGFQGPSNTSVTLTVLYDSGGTDVIAALTMGDKQTLNVCPTGHTAGLDLWECTTMELISRSFTEPYDGAIEWTVGFNSVDAVTYTTYSTA